MKIEKVPFCSRMKKETFERMKKTAFDLDISISDMVEIAISRYIQEHERQCQQQEDQK